MPGSGLEPRMGRSIRDPVSGAVYSLAHLVPFPITFLLRVGDGSVEVEMFVRFSRHCYTRSRKDGDPGEAVVFREKKRHGQVDERVFCKTRWEFSKSLPDIIRGLHDKQCFPGNSKELIYRQEGAPYPGDHGGWYVCLRLGVDNRRENFTLSVRSAHLRSNRPLEIRGPGRRFYALLARFYDQERGKRAWL